MTKTRRRMKFQSKGNRRKTKASLRRYEMDYNNQRPIMKQSGPCSEGLNYLVDNGIEYMIDEPIPRCGHSMGGEECIDSVVAGNQILCNREGRLYPVIRDYSLDMVVYDGN